MARARWTIDDPSTRKVVRWAQGYVRKWRSPRDTIALLDYVWPRLPDFADSGKSQRKVFRAVDCKVLREAWVVARLGQYLDQIAPPCKMRMMGDSAAGIDAELSLPSGETWRIDVVEVHPQGYRGPRPKTARQSRRVITSGVSDEFRRQFCGATSPETWIVDAVGKKLRHHKSGSGVHLLAYLNYSGPPDGLVNLRGMLSEGGAVFESVWLLQSGNLVEVSSPRSAPPA